MATLAQTSLTFALAHSGAEVLTEAAVLNFYAHDICSRGADLAAVVRPRDGRQPAAAVKAATSAGSPIIPRGGGMSYTGGYLAGRPGAVLFDLARMDRVLLIDEDDMTVTLEAGCTWAKLYEALAPRGLRTPMWGTLSGLKASIGGGMSQNAIFWGSARHGTAAQSCIALEVVLADGTLLALGRRHARPYGPDLVGLFLADTGALGIKATITLKLAREAEAHGYASFAFAEPAAWLAVASEIERWGLASECFGFDPKLNTLRMQRESLAGDARQLIGMMKRQSGVVKAPTEGARVVAAGRCFLKDASYSLHVLAEGRIQAAADEDVARMRHIAVEHGGCEIEYTIPKIIRANPFGPLNSILGPNGDRWGPVHGLLAHSAAPRCLEAVRAVLDKRGEEMERLGVTCATLIAAVGGAGLVIEPCLYWPDARNPLIEDTLEPAHLRKMRVLPENGPARALVDELKQAMVDVFLAHDAAHLQIGRIYRYRDSLEPAADDLLGAIKRELDPQRLMNPGSLGLG